MNLFQGAIGVSKNALSHKQVDYDDPTEASEVVLFTRVQSGLLAYDAFEAPTGQSVTALGVRVTSVLCDLGPDATSL